MIRWRFVDAVRDLLTQTFSKAELESLLFEFSHALHQRGIAEMMDIETVGSTESSKEYLVLRLMKHCTHRNTLALLNKLARAKRST